jgi:hypothetical protein
VVLGVFREPEVFFRLSKKAQHPSDLGGSIPDEIAVAIQSMLKSSPKQYSEQMLKEIRELTKLVHDSFQEDAASISAMGPLGARVMNGKRLHTMSLLIKKYGYKESTLALDLAQGFDVTGFKSHSGISDHQVVLPEVTSWRAT